MTATTVDVDAATYAALDAGTDETDLFPRNGLPLDWWTLRGAR